MQSSPETLLKSLNASADTNVGQCILMWRLGCLTGQFMIKFGKPPTDKNIYTLWHHEELALGVPYKHLPDDIKKRANNFAETCKRRRSESGQDKVDNDDAGDKIAT